VGGIIKLEIDRNVNKWIIWGILIFIVLSIVILQLGISKYKTELKQNDEFVEVEARKIQRYINYMQFGIYGFRRLLVSSPLMAMFYNSTTIGDLQAFIDNGVRLNFSKPEIGKNVFERPTGGTLDFSWYLLIPASLIIMPWGFFSFRPREYLWSLMGYTKAANVYWGIMLGRILIVFTTLSLTTVIIYFQFLVNGITLSGREILSLPVFLLTSTLVLIFLLGISAGLGAMENWVKGGIIAFCSWFIIVMLWPEILNVVFSKKAEANMKSIYKHEMQKTDKLMEFEKEALKNTGRYETIPEKIESDRRMAEHYWENVSKDIEKLGKGILNRRFKEINAMTKAGVLFKLALLKQAGIYIFHDFLNYLPTFNTTDMMDDLKEQKTRGVIFVDLISRHGGNIGSDFNAAIHEGENGFEKMVIQDYQ